MECMSCNSTKKMNEEIVSHKYSESGLSNITLLGVTKYHCDNCGETTYNLGDVNQLNKLIVNSLIRKDSLLNGEEVKFLRKFMGYSGEMLGKIMGYTKDHIYKVESGSQEVNITIDHMMRFAVVNKDPDRYYDVHDLILNGSGVSSLEILKLQKTKKGWELAKGA